MKAVRKYSVIIDEAELDEIRIKEYELPLLVDKMTRLYEMSDEQEIHWVRGIDRNGEAFEGWVEDDEVSDKTMVVLFTVSGWDVQEIGFEVSE